MNLKVKDHFHGFTVGRIRPIPGQTGEFVEMTYDKTRTELVWVNNGAVICHWFQDLAQRRYGGVSHPGAFRPVRF